jgi:hypothetical protein
MIPAAPQPGSRHTGGLFGAFRLRILSKAFERHGSTCGKLRITDCVEKM